jgi:hypothetical protein
MVVVAFFMVGVARPLLEYRWSALGTIACRPLRVKLCLPIVCQTGLVIHLPPFEAFLKSRRLSCGRSRTNAEVLTLLYSDPRRVRRGHRTRISAWMSHRRILDRHGVGTDRRRRTMSAKLDPLAAAPEELAPHIDRHHFEP